MTQTANPRTGDDAGTDALRHLRIERGPAARRRRPWLRRLVALAVVALLAFLVAGPLRGAMFPNRVTTTTVARVASTQGHVRTTASGYVVARRRASISSRLSGRLESLLVDVGDRVEKDQLIGRLGQQDLVAAVAEARAAVEQAKLAIPVLERRIDVTAATVTTAESRLSQDEAAVATATDRLEEAERVLRLEKGLLASGSSSTDAVDSARADRDIRATEVASAKAAVAVARAEVAQARQEEGVLRAQIAAAGAGVTAAEAALQRAEALRADADIRAPFDGIVLRKEAEVGEMVAPVNAAGSTTRGALVTVADFASLEMEVDVIERDIGRVVEGLPCRIVLDSRTKPYAGRVRQIVPTADRTRGTVQVKVTFDALDEAVLPEMSGRVEFLDEDAADAALGRDRVLVDARALARTADGWAAWTVQDGTVRRVAVTVAVGEPVDGRREVTAGLRGGEDVVIDPAPALADGMEVTAASEADAGSR